MEILPCFQDIFHFLNQLPLNGFMKMFSRQWFLCKIWHNVHWYSFHKALLFKIWLVSQYKCIHFIKVSLNVRKLFLVHVYFFYICFSVWLFRMTSVLWVYMYALHIKIFVQNMCKICVKFVELPWNELYINIHLHI